MSNNSGIGTSLLVASLGTRFQEAILSDFFGIFDHRLASESDSSAASSASENQAGGPDKPLNLEFPVFQDESICTMVNENPADAGIERMGWTRVPAPQRQGAHSPAISPAAHMWSKMQKSASLCRRGWSAMDPSNKAAENSDQQLEYVSKKERAADLKQPPQWCSINEPVEISIGVQNPFRVPLVLKNLRLVAEIEEGASSVSEEKAGGSNSGNNGSDPVLIAPIDRLALEPLTAQTLRLRVVPLHTGTLRITGLRWELENTEGAVAPGAAMQLVHCVHIFQLRGKPLNDTRKNRAMGVRMADTRLMVTVVGRRPWIGATLEAPICGPPQQAAIAHGATRAQRRLILAGQLLQVQIKMKNFGDGAANYVSLVCGKPDLVVPQGIPAVGATSDTSLFLLSDSMPLDAGEEKDITLLIRAPSSPGTHDVNMMLEYCSEPSIPTDIGECLLSVVACIPAPPLPIFVVVVVVVVVELVVDSPHNSFWLSPQLPPPPLLLLPTLSLVIFQRPQVDVRFR